MDAEKFGSFLADLRKEQGMTQAELANKLQVTDKAVSRWERGIGFPDISTLEPLSDALHVTVLELLRSERIDRQDISPGDASEAVIDTIIIATAQQNSFRKRMLVFCTGMLLFWALPCMALLIGYTDFPFQAFFQFLLPLITLVSIEYLIYEKNQIAAVLIPIVVAFSGVALGVNAFIIAAALFIEYFTTKHMGKSVKTDRTSADDAEKQEKEHDS